MKKKKKPIDYVALGSIGGKNTAKKYGSEYMKKIARNGAKKRWKK